MKNRANEQIQAGKVETSRDRPRRLVRKCELGDYRCQLKRGRTKHRAFWQHIEKDQPAASPATEFHARIASAEWLSNHWIVCRSPSRKDVFARQPNSFSAREVSRQRRGCPSGFVASHRTGPSKPISERICSSRSRMPISSPDPRFTSSG